MSRSIAVAVFAASLLVAGSNAGAQRRQVPSDSGGLAGALARASSARAAARDTARFDDVFRKYSKRYFGAGFDWRYFKAQGMAESELNPQAKSWVGARGVMQLMPSTFAAIQTKRPEFQSIDDPEWNIAAGIMHDRYLWRLWQRGVDEPQRRSFMFASYNAGEGTIARACSVARAAQLDSARWENIEQVAPKVQRWRYRETLGYVRKIESNYARLRTSKRSSGR
jgi:membrane-bound lytic murein transglycosylase MltF